MTISYSAEVANSSKFGCFWRILCKWRGSVYKLIWRDLAVYLLLYYALNVVYRFALNDQQKTTFEKVRNYFAQQSESIPMSFVLGFYVSMIVKRWWEQYRLLPWPDSLALFVSAAIPGVDERGRLMRRNIVRYAVLSYVITLQRVSFRVKKRFPTWQHMVDAGLMMDSEKKIFEMMDEKSDMSKYWMPLIWATNIINRARREALVTSDHVVQSMLVELSDIRRRLGSLIGYDTVCVPLVYTQVVTLSVYTYFMSALMGRQFVGTEESASGLDMYVPFFTVLQFCFYIGWLKVAEVLINPFGEDDDDIELNWLIDRHIKAAYMIVDEMHEEHPELLKDQYWEEVVPTELPYTLASGHFRRSEPKGSAETFVVKEADSMYANVPRSKVPVEDYADYESVDTPLVERRGNWFRRQLQRMGSGRSSGTTYATAPFGRTRHNSVYSSPECGGIGVGVVNGGGGQPANGAHHPHKMSLYDRLVGRKSGRRVSRSGTGKMNGAAVPVTLKNRPRIPTPDVTKEVVDREHRLASLGGGGAGGSGGGGGPGQALQSAYQSELPVLQVVLSPIKELGGEGGVVGTPSSVPPSALPSSVTASGAGGSSTSTAALAQAVLSPALTSAGLSPVPVPVSVPVAAAAAAAVNGRKVLTTMTITPVTMSGAPPSPALALQPITLTDVTSGSEDDSGVASDRSRKTSVASQSQTKRGEVYV
ncbi:bestrophin-4 [Schistocerca gregaria]|uniref:bestrophin-4 n=1 Tax=Schistocerca gregaria TaxID=7010 RepID=UPI00211EB30B|nr:bestrophin-4 [Schistocerca gregaria]